MVKLKKDEKYGLGECVLFLTVLSKWKRNKDGTLGMMGEVYQETRLCSVEEMA